MSHVFLHLPYWGSCRFQRVAPASEASGAHALGLVSCTTTHTSNNPDGIVVDTRKSRLSKMSRSVLKGANLHTEHQAAAFSSRTATIMATLTYRPRVEPKPEHITSLLNHARNWFKRKCGGKLRYVWTAELTKKGKLHYHILFFLPPRVRLPLFDLRGWWPHGMTRLEWAKNPIAYIAKYASKGNSKGKFPKGFRIHGCGGLTKPEAADKRYHCAPSWVREVFAPDEDPRPIDGGGWVSRITGEWWPSPYELLYAASGRVVVRVAPWATPLFGRQGESP